MGVFAEHALDLTQEVGERRLPITGGIGKVSAAPERLSVRREEHRQRPAAVLTEVVQSRHVDLVDVGTLFAIHFDVDEQIVHDLRSFRVLETLVRHHMAPMAGRIADREQDRFVGALCFGERLGSPRPPVDRIVFMLKQVGARLVRETVLVGRGD